jgi:hypothetical protein
MIGIGNNLLEKFCDMIREFCEKMSAKEVALERQIAIYEIIIGATAKERNEFDCSPDGRKLQRMITSRRRKVKVRNTPPDNATELLQADIKSKEK